MNTIVALRYTALQQHTSSRLCPLCASVTDTPWRSSHSF